MKAKNNNTENRKSKIKNAFLKGGAIIVSFILISFTVSAQNFWKQLLTESSLSNVAMIMAGNSGTKAEVKTTSSISNTETEDYFYVIEEEKDEPLKLESWMLSERFFDNSSYFLSQDVDSTLEIEDWMLNNKYFKNEPTTIRTENDKELRLESWMVNKKVWRM